ncbi:MAG: hypothetical protein FWH26_00360 [Oscillospiraceae bacterium]|nr:hypothetical protein [Oscillospiraceae bacterium]
MQTVVLVMRRGLAAQGLMRKLRGDPDLRLTYEPAYSRADVALIEVAESGRQDISYCLSLCDRLQTEAPLCKRLLMCPEQDGTAVARAVEAKRAGRIDDFVFYDATPDYLVSKLLSM